MANAQVEMVSMSEWSGGLNTETPWPNLLPNELRTATDVTLTLTGQIQKRLGFVDYSASENAAMTEGRYLFFWNQLGSTNDWFIYVDTDGDVFASVNTDFSAAAVADFTIGSTDTIPVSATSFDNVFYITSRRANPRSFDGTTWTEITDITLDGDGGEFPKASFILSKHERMFAANIDNNGTIERSRVRWSNVGDATTWGTLSWVDVDPDDGTQITGMVGFADGILIFKDHSMFFLSGVDEDTFTLFPVDSTVGTRSPGTIAIGGKAVYFLDNSKGVFRYDGTGVEILSRKIETNLSEEFNSSASWDYYTATFYRDKYYLTGFLPAQTTRRTYVFDVRLDAWVKWTLAWSDSAEREGVLYTVGTAKTGTTVGIFKMFTATDDNGAYSTATVNTAFLPFGAEGSISPVQNRLRAVDLLFGDRDSGPDAISTSVVIAPLLDFRNDTGVSDTVNLDANDTDADFSIVRVRAQAVGGATSFPALHSAIAINVVFGAVAGTTAIIMSGINIYFSRRRSMRRSGFVT